MNMKTHGMKELASHVARSEARTSMNEPGTGQLDFDERTSHELFSIASARRAAPACIVTIPIRAGIELALNMMTLEQKVTLLLYFICLPREWATGSDPPWAFVSRMSSRSKQLGGQFAVSAPRS